MSMSRVKVGLPLDQPRGKTRLSWSPPRTRRPGPGRALDRARAASRPAGPPEEAPAHIAAKPLSFLSARNFFVLFAVSAMAICLVGLMVRSNHLAMSHSYEISELTGQKVELLEVNRQLQTELAQLGSLEHLETAARETLGLITPRQGQIVVIE